MDTTPIPPLPPMDELLTPPDEALMCLAVMVSRSIADTTTIEGKALQVCKAMVGWANALLEQNRDLHATRAARRASGTWTVPRASELRANKTTHGGPAAWKVYEQISLLVASQSEKLKSLRDQVAEETDRRDAFIASTVSDEHDGVIEQAAVQRLANALRWKGSVDERGPIRGERLVRLLAQAEQLVPVPEDLNPALSDDEQQAWRALSARHAAEITELRAEEYARRNPPTPTPHWMYSSQEEEWSNGSECESREVAVSEALRELDLVAGDRFWTGITDKIDSEEMAAGTGSWESHILDLIENWLHDELGGDVDVEIRCSDIQRKELDDEVGAVVKRWLDRHALAPQCWRVEQTCSHVARNCECTRSTPDGLGDDRCKICGGCGLVLDVEESDATP